MNYNEAFKPVTEPPLFQKKKGDIIISAMLFALSVLGVSAVFWNGSRFGYTAVYLISLVAVSAYLFRRGAKVHILYHVTAALSAACSLVFTFTSNPSVKMFAFIVSALGAFVWFSALSGREYMSGDLGIAEYIITSAISCFVDMPRALKALFTKKEKKTGFAKALIGAVCAVPLLIIVIPLLVKSDDAFSSLFNSISEGLGTAAGKVIAGLFVAPFTVGFTLSLKHNRKCCEIGGIKKKLNKITLCSFLSVLSAVYLCYLLSQLAYFFSAFSSILPSGYTFSYAEYARRGFFELCVIAAINLVVIIAAIAVAEKEKQKLPSAVKIPATFIAVFTLIIVAASISKMIMYIEAYGLTVLRVCTSAFMIWMAIVFIFALIRLYVRRLDILFAGLVAALSVILVLGFANVNLLVADYNYNIYKDTGNIDVSYMSSLGDEGVKYLVLLAEDGNEDAQEKISAKLYDYYKLDTTPDNIRSYEQFKKLDKKDRSIGKFSLPRKSAYDALDSYAFEYCVFVYCSKPISNR